MIPGARSAVRPPAACLLAALALAASPAPAENWAGDPDQVVVCEGYEELLLCGDATGDCKVSAADALSTLRMAVGEIAVEPEADMDLSGAVTAADALKVLRIAVGSLGPSYDCDPEHIVLPASATGFYDPAGAHTPGNYAVGWYKNSSTELRDYFVFDLAGVEATVLAASIRVDTAPKGYVIYGSSDPSENFRLVAVSTPIAALANGTGGVAAYDDLADGTTLGGITATSADFDEQVDIPLNSTAVTALNAASGKVAFGGSITTLAKGLKNEFLFNSTTASLTRLLILKIAPVM